MKKSTHLLKIALKTTQSMYFFHSRLFKFHSLVQLLLPMTNLNGVSQPISIEHNMVRGLNQAVFRT